MNKIINLLFNMNTESISKYVAYSLFALLFISNYSFAQKEKQDSIPFKNLESYLDGYIKNTIDPDGKIPTSVTLSIVKDGKLLFAKGYGPENIEKKTLVSPDKSIFRIGSTSKTFTYTAIMQLYEQGKVDLDTNVNTYLKDFKIPDTYEKPVTIRSIVTHTTGFEDGLLGHLYVDSEEKMIPLREAVERYMPARVSPVGDHSAYSNFAIALLGLIVEDVSGLSYESYIEKYIHKPLAMNNSTFLQPLPKKYQEHLAIPYKNIDGKNVAQEFILIANDAPAGAMSSTAHDMANFMLMHLGDGTYNNAQVLKSESANYMRKWQYGPDKNYPGMAFGFYQMEFNGHRLYGHSGGTLNFTTDMMLDVKNNLGLFISSTGYGSGSISQNFVLEFYNNYFPAKESKKVLVTDAPKDFNTRADQYTGQYFNWIGNFSQVEKLRHLMGGTKVEASDHNTLLINGEEYVEIAKHTFKKVENQNVVLFTEDANGKVKNMHLSQPAVYTMSKGPFYLFGDFNLPALAIAFFLFFTAIIVSIYHRFRKKESQPEVKNVRKIAFWLAITSFVFVLLLAFVGITHGMKIAHTIPWYFNFIMLFPIIASILTVVLVYKTIKLWGVNKVTIRPKTYYSLIALGGLFMVWFYYFWNILGFQYF